MSVSNIIMAAKEVFVDRVAVSIKISLRRLVDGGALMFAAAVKNHQKVMAGKWVSSPFVRKRLRVPIV